MAKFISEDDLQTFDGWLSCQCIDPATTDPQELETWREIYNETRARSSTHPKFGRMKLRQAASEYRYAVAVRDSGELWLALWVRRSPKGEFFVFFPRGERDWDIHTSYHLDGTIHLKTHGRKVFEPFKGQPLTGTFRGTEHLGAFAGYGPKSVGAICDPAAFAGVLELPPGVLGPRDGQITVDLIEPNHQPHTFPWAQIVQSKVFKDNVPWVVVTVGTTR